VYVSVLSTGSDVSQSFLSTQRHIPLKSESNQSHLKFFQVRVMTSSSHKNSRFTSSHWFPSSSHRRVTQNFNFSTTFLCYEMAPNML